MSESLKSPSRRLLLLGVLVATGALVYAALQRRETSPLTRGGDFTLCAKQRGDDARACYHREVGRELAAMSAAPAVAVSAPADSGQITFASLDSGDVQDPSLLCALHTRVGVTDEQAVSWLGWKEPLAEAAAPAS